MDLVFLPTLSISSPSAPPLNFKVFQCSVPAIKSTKVCPKRCRTPAPSVTGNFEMEAVWKVRQLQSSLGLLRDTKGLFQVCKSATDPSAEAPHPGPFPASPFPLPPTTRGSRHAGRQAEASKCFLPCSHSVMRRSLRSCQTQRACWEVCLEVKQVWLCVCVCRATSATKANADIIHLISH